MTIGIRQYAAAEESGTNPESLKVLIVDDEFDQRRLFCHFLRKAGYHPIPASSGAEAIARVRSCRPDLALIDISMPEVDGITLTKAFRSNKETADMPVILMTGLSAPEAMLAATARDLRVGPILTKGQGLDRVVSLIGRNKHTGPIRSASEGDILSRGPITLNLRTREAWVSGHRILKDATKRFELLAFFVGCDRPISREEMLKHVWNDSENLNVVDVTLLRLRQDLERFHHVRIVRTDGSSKGYQLVIQNFKPGRAEKVLRHLTACN